MDDHANHTPPRPPQFKSDGAAMRLDSGMVCILNLELTVEEIEALREYFASKHEMPPVNLERMLQMVKNCRSHVRKENRFLESALRQ